MDKTEKPQKLYTIFFIGTPLYRSRMIRETPKAYLFENEIGYYWGNLKGNTGRFWIPKSILTFQRREQNEEDNSITEFYNCADWFGKPKFTYMDENGKWDYNKY